MGRQELVDASRLRGRERSRWYGRRLWVEGVSEKYALDGGREMLTCLTERPSKRSMPKDSSEKPFFL